MSIRCKALVARIVLIASIWLGGCMFSIPIDISGQWVGMLEYTSGPAAGFLFPFTLDVIFAHNDLTGTITLPSHGTFTFELPLNSGRAKNPNIRFEAFGTNPNLDPPPTVSITMEGTYDADSMSGEGSQTVDGATYEFVWEASFVPPPDPPAGENQ